MVDGGVSENKKSPPKNLLMRCFAINMISIASHQLYFTMAEDFFILAPPCIVECLGGRKFLR